MKFQPDRAEGVNLISRHVPGEVWVGGHPHRQSVVVPWQGAVQAWPAREHADLSPDHFASLLQTQPELVIYGSGSRLRFPAPRLFSALVQAGVGLETMDTAAACRTFNVLASEGRKVVAALLLAG